MKAITRDYLNFANEPKIKKLLEPDEKVIFSGKLGKYNPYLRKQERNLLITNKYLYNLKGTSNKRKIAIANVEAVTKSTAKGNYEFVIHIPIEYDYRYIGELREETIQTLKEQYSKNYSKNLPIYGVPESSLEGYVNAKDAKKKNQYKIPAETYRLVSENLIMENLSASPVKEYDLLNLSYVKSALLYAKNPPGVPLSSFRIAKALAMAENEKEYLAETVAGSKELYVLKVLEKAPLFEIDAITAEFVCTEVGKSAGHPFLLQPETVYKGEGALYLLFPFTGGKTLSYILGQAKRFNERKVKFYGHQIALALSHFHSRGIVYRELRPDNILIDEKGYIKLNDFGTYRFLPPVKRRPYISSTLLKYPSRQEYLPPEHFWDKDPNGSADWWSFGILLYEMLIGVTPFYSEDPSTQQDHICNKPLSFPAPLKHYILLTDSVRSLLTRLLCKDPQVRLGGEAVLEHEFFQTKDWDKERLLKKQADLKYVFLQRDVTTELATDNNTEEPITQLYPIMPKSDVCKKFNQL